MLAWVNLANNVNLVTFEHEGSNNIEQIVGVWDDDL